MQATKTRHSVLPIRPISLASLSLDYLLLWVQRGRPDECWEWLGEQNRKGRGYIRATDEAGRMIYLNAPRTIWGFVHGRESIKKKTLHHKCEYPLCCNLRHLQPMTKVAHVDLHRPKEGV